MAKIPKRPKMPKKSASLSTWEKWAKNMEAWKKKRDAIKAAPLKKEKIASKFRGI